MIKEAKSKAWSEFGKNLNKDYKTATKRFYKTIKVMRTRTEKHDPTELINDKEGKPISNKQRTLRRWKEYFSELLNTTLSNNTAKETIQSCNEQEPNILIEEIAEVIKKAKNNKAPGIDNIPLEIIRAAGVTGLYWLHRIFNTAWRQQKTPTDWRKSIIVPIWKRKGSKRDCNQYRGISLLSHAGKLYAKIVEKRLRPVLEQQLSNTQMGFRRNRGCTDAIFILKQLAEKSIEYNQNLYISLIDQEKAFDRVNREKLWETLKTYGVHQHLINICRSLYTNSRCTVRTAAGYTEDFVISTGVKQGCVLSPLLFITYMDHINKTANPNETNELLFADDQVLFHNSIQNLQEHLNILDTTGKQFGMKINIDKTEIMNIAREKGNINIQINNKQLKQVDEFKYLGSILRYDNKQEAEIDARCNKACQIIGQLTPLLQNKDVTIETKRALFNTIFLPTLCYQCQTWTLDSRTIHKINTTEMKCVRRMIGVSLRDKIRNEELRKQLGITSTLE